MRRPAGPQRSQREAEALNPHQAAEPAKPPPELRPAEGEERRLVRQPCNQPVDPPHDLRRTDHNVLNTARGASRLRALEAHGQAALLADHAVGGEGQAAAREPERLPGTQQRVEAQVEKKQQL